jgi:hypothetical protein
VQRLSVLHASKSCCINNTYLILWVLAALASVVAGELICILLVEWRVSARVRLSGLMVV